MFNKPPYPPDRDAPPRARTDLVERSSTFGADNGDIADGQLPDEYSVKHLYEDGVLVLSAAEGGHLEFTLASFVRMVREADQIVGSNHHLLTRITMACGK